jgi:hypothetical protein
LDWKESHSVFIAGNPNSTVAAGRFPPPEKIPVKLGRYHGSPLHFHWREILGLVNAETIAV